MKTGLSVSLLFLLVASTVTAKGHGETLRSKRGLTIYDLVRGTTTAAPQTPKPTKENVNGFDLADALNPNPNPANRPNGGSCQAMAQQLSQVIENQKKQFSMLERVMARLNMRPV